MPTTLIAASWVLACNDRDELRLLRDHSVIVEDNHIAAIVPTGQRSGGAVQTIWSQLRAEHWFGD